MNNYDDFIFPDSSEKICIVKAENSKELKGYKLDGESNLYNLIMKELNTSYFMSMIKLFQCSRNLSNNISGPNVLYLSENEGCFPRKGLYIKEADEYAYYKDLNYVDLVLDEDRVLNGDLYIYTHELAHTMIKNIMPDFPQGKSSIPHFSQCVTDYFTAFDEGFAESFEHTTCDNIKDYFNLKNNKLNFENNIIKLWICEFDAELRYDGVLKNSFIYNKLMPEIENLSLEEKLLLEQTCPNFNLASLKTGSEMLSCEGVIATIFYSLINDKVLQNNYASDDIYNKFLLMPAQNIKDIFTPYENVIIKFLWTFNIIGPNIKEDSVIFIDFIKAWCSSFPSDKERLISIFINITKGKTVENDLGNLYEQIAVNGMLGKAENMSRLIKEYKDKTQEICNKVLHNDLAIDNNVLKESWVQNNTVNTPEIFYPSNEKKPMMINLNTASFLQLMSLPNMTSASAYKIIENR